MSGMPGFERLLPYNFGEYNRSISGFGNAWPVDLSISGQTGVMVQQVGVSHSVPSPDPYTGWPPPPDGYDITFSNYQRQMWFFLFDISNVDWDRMFGLRFTMEPQGGFLAAYEIALPNDPMTHPMPPTHSNVSTLSADWISGDWAGEPGDPGDINAAISSYEHLQELQGTAFSGISIVDWFDPLYSDNSTGTVPAMVPGTKRIMTGGWPEHLRDRDWAGLLVAFDQEPSWFYGQFDIDTFDPDANPVTWTFYNVYSDAATLAVNPVAGVSLDVIPLAGGVELAGEATLFGLEVSGRLRVGRDRQPLIHTARKLRGW